MLPYQSVSLEANLISLFERAHGDLLRAKNCPPINVSFYPFVNLNHTIRLRKGKINVRLSDICRDAPIRILEAIAQLLLAKLYKRKPDKVYSATYKAYREREEVRAKVEIARRSRSRRLNGTHQGKVYNLKEIFDKLNRRYFRGRLQVDHLEWSRNSSTQCLGRYDEFHNRIIISQSLDNRTVHSFLVEYIVYHEMLHMVHPSQEHNGRHWFHHAKFREDEKKFPFYLQAHLLLKNINRALVD